MVSLGIKVKEDLIGNFGDFNSLEDFPDFLPGHGPHFRNVGHAMGSQEFPHVEVQAALGISV
jgi:hypothetical protein